MGKTLDLCGVRFGRLTVVFKCDWRQSGCVMWSCLCDCGGATVLSTGTLRSGNTQSCGCLGNENRAMLSRKYTWKHGRAPSKDATYRSWKSMRERCHNPHNPMYHRYGGRNIEVCSRWDKFRAFLEDMGERPKGTTLDRMDNN